MHRTYCRRILLCLSLMAFLASFIKTAPAQFAAARSDVNSPPELARISERMRDFVSSGEIAGAVTLVATPDKILHLAAVGEADVNQKAPMSGEAIFWIASMTKPITAAAVLMMQDEGKLSVDDRVGKYIPELADLKTPSGQAANITIRHLLTHTSGLAEATADQAKVARRLADLIPVYARQPVAFEPGSRWQYSQSGINTAARIVEIVARQEFDEFLRQKFFDPLGMKDTTFYLSRQQLSRLAKSYRRADGALRETAISILNGRSPDDRDRYPAANGGLFSTAADYARFCQMILKGGEFDNRRYLKPESVKLMTSLQTGELKTGFTDGNGWGLGWCLVRQPQGVTATLSAGTFGHGGAYGTQAWIDPQRKLIYILMVQRANFPNADNSEVRRAFQETAAALMK